MKSITTLTCILTALLISTASLHAAALEALTDIEGVEYIVGGTSAGILFFSGKEVYDSLQKNEIQLNEIPLVCNIKPKPRTPDIIFVFVAIASTLL